MDLMAQVVLMYLEQAEEVTHRIAPTPYHTHRIAPTPYYIHLPSPTHQPTWQVDLDGQMTHIAPKLLKQDLEGLCDRANSASSPCQ